MRYGGLGKERRGKRNTLLLDDIIQQIDEEWCERQKKMVEEAERSAFCSSSFILVRILCAVFFGRYSTQFAYFLLSLVFTLYSFAPKNEHYTNAKIQIHAYRMDWNRRDSNNFFLFTFVNHIKILLSVAFEAIASIKSEIHLMLDFSDGHRQPIGLLSNGDFSLYDILKHMMS